MKRLCEQCKTELPEEAKFCPICGTAVPEEPKQKEIVNTIEDDDEDDGILRRINDFLERHGLKEPLMNFIAKWAFFISIITCAISWKLYSNLGDTIFTLTEMNLFLGILIELILVALFASPLVIVGQFSRDKRVKYPFKESTLHVLYSITKAIHTVVKILLVLNLCLNIYSGIRAFGFCTYMVCGVIYNNRKLIVLAIALFEMKYIFNMPRNEVDEEKK